jgi:lipopolysaccharide transport system ATP-binding protein
MSNPVIKIENIGKKYVLRHQNTRGYKTLRDTLVNGTKSLIHNLTHPQATTNKNLEEFWALKDLNFEIQQGDRLGIIGRNGAGKSTLLKILSRITEPTIGKITLKGRIASLLEVGTGFHPELTGRENVFLNGAILGMSKQEIKQKFDEIIDFAEIEKFLDTPVKRYSSGMYVRLAFAVAAHLEPEVLIVDEVLAVGDVRFQKKCLGKMQDAGQEGRTILFVSHNMAVLPNLCNRGILLEGGRLMVDDTVSTAVDAYLNILENVSSQDLTTRSDRRGKGEIILTQVNFFTTDHLQRHALTTGLPAKFIFQVNQLKPGLSCSFTLYNQYNQPVANFNSAIASENDWQNTLGSKISCEIQQLLLVPGRYQLNVSITWNQELQDHLVAAAMVEVLPGMLQGRVISKNSDYGSVALPHVWDLTE